MRHKLFKFDPKELAEGNDWPECQALKGAGRPYFPYQGRYKVAFWPVHHGLGLILSKALLLTLFGIFLLLEIFLECRPRIAKFVSSITNC